MAAWLLSAVAAVPASAQEPAQHCRVIISVEHAGGGSGDVAALEMHLDYGSVAGEFEGTGAEVDCAAMAPDVLAFENDLDDSRELNLGMISPSAVALPADFWDCGFVTEAAAPLPEDFTLTVDDALSADSTTLDVHAFVSDIVCSLEAVCGDGVIGGDEECDDGEETPSCTANCRLSPELQVCLVGFRVEGASTLGGLQFTVDYSQADGQFEGSGVNVSCTSALEAAFTLANDREADSELELAFLAPSGVTPPADLWQCRFLTSAVSTSGSDFPISSLSAIDLGLSDVAAEVIVETLGCNGGPICGDGLVEGAEECEDSNTTDTDTCTNTCRNARCGDAITGPGEQCDDGNTSDTDSCTNVCANARCGDAIVGPGEQCDDGNTASTDLCTNVCKNARCGDTIVGPGEQCDDGNVVNTDLCTNICQTARCGDFIVGPGEQCDDGNTIDTDTCTGACTVAVCGDSIVGPGEQCDDGNTVATDSCTNACFPATCGDFIVGPDEQCDDGNLIDTDGCTNACNEAVCGDAIGGPGEECDDGNTVDTDVCTNDCRFAACGDSIVGPGEQCDDGNTTDTDQCTNGCRDARCGDAIIGPGEQCDDGNTIGSDACTNLCKDASCGDSITGPGETCDDGNTTDGDGCSAACQTEVLCGDADGNGAVQAGDALRVLKNAVGQPGECPLTACDANGSGSVTAADALRVLRRAVGQDIEMSCPTA